jgi:uncharacterized membrane protein YgdD (TMEM256/DUF423 family)
MPTQLPFSFIAALLGALAVALGAFGAHALKDRLTPYELGVFETAVRYQFYHVFALFSVDVLAWMARGHGLGALPELRTAGWAFTLGIALFSGSLYAIVATGLKKFGMVTPFGGVAFLVGWVSLAMAAWKIR